MQERYLFGANSSQHQTVGFMLNLDTVLFHVTGSRGSFNSFQVREFKGHYAVHRIYRSLVAEIQATLFFLLSSEEEL